MSWVTNSLIRQFCLVKQTEYLLSYKLQVTITLQNKSKKRTWCAHEHSRLPSLKVL